MDAEGIREIARMQYLIDKYDMALEAILIVLDNPNRGIVFPTIDLPDFAHIIEKIRELQKQNRLNERGKD